MNFEEWKNVIFFKKNVTLEKFDKTMNLEREVNFGKCELNLKMINVARFARHVLKCDVTR